MLGADICNYSFAYQLLAGKYRMNLNKVFIIGRVVVDPETRNTSTGQNVSTLRVATNRVWNKNGEKQEQVEFHAVVAWGKLSDIIEKYLKKGQMVMFEGRLQTRSWEGSDKVKRYRTEIVAENMQLGPKSTMASVSSEGRFVPKRNQGDASEIKEEDIPVINQDEPFDQTTTKPIKDIDEAEIDLKDIPF